MRYEESPVIIAGMHRSGTSVIAQLMQLGGADLGRRLLPPDASNPRGHVENLDFVELHESALKQAGVPAAGWVTEPVAVSSEFIANARRVATANSRLSLWGWKDPRTTLFLSMWDDIFPRALYVLTYRGPGAVADSILRRRGTADGPVLEHPELAIDVWTFYNRTILAFISERASRCVLLNADDLVREPRAALSLIEMRLGLGIVVDDLANHVSASIFRSSAELSLFEEGLAHEFPDAARLHRKLLAASGSAAVVPSDPKRLRVRSALQDLYAENESLRAQLEDAKRAVGEASRARDEADAVAEASLQERSKAGEVSTSLLRSLEQERATTSELKSQLTRSALEAGRLRTDLSAATRDATRASGEVDRLAGFVSGLRRSRSWRMTAPLRAANQRLMALKARTTSGQASRLRGQRSGVEEARASWLLTRAMELRSAYERPSDPPADVDIVIPMFRGLNEARVCVESVLRSAVRTTYRLIVIEDCSPEPELSLYLAQLARDDKVTLVVNRQNLGFAATANIGMSVHPERDVVLLNSDTEVAGDWLDRLRAHALGSGVGTVTPFSNNATICSYPNMYAPTPSLPHGFSVAELDSLCARSNARVSVEIPTGVGFCMYVRRDLLNDVGLFDDDRFAPGYGEENDLCLRGESRGWSNLLATDVFVVHVGAVSFRETQEDRKALARGNLIASHPTYESRVRRWIEQDPAAPARLRVDLALAKSRGPRVLVVTHGDGGGTERSVREQAARHWDEMRFLRIRPHPDGSEGFELARLQPEERFNLPPAWGKDYSEIVSTLRQLEVSRVHYHHLVQLPLRMRLLAADLGLPYEVTVHDYYYFCPQKWLVAADHGYCGEPDIRGCGECLATRPAPEGHTIQSWREMMRVFLEGADSVLCPSEFVVSRMRRHFPDAPIVFSPHEEPISFRTTQVGPVFTPRSAERLRVAVLGALNEEKGADVLEAAALDARRRRLPIEFDLVGYAYRQLTSEPRANLRVRGPYADADLDGLLAEIAPDIIWFPAQGPESYSYTLSAALRAGLPVAVTDLGALPERVSGRPWSWVLDWRTTARDWNDFFGKLRGSTQAVSD